MSLKNRRTNTNGINGKTNTRTKIKTITAQNLDLAELLNWSSCARYLFQTYAGGVGEGQGSYIFKWKQEKGFV